MIPRIHISGLTEQSMLWPLRRLARYVYAALSVRRRRRRELEQLLRRGAPGLADVGLSREEVERALGKHPG